MANFSTRCRNAVKRFVRTVVIIDDEAVYSPNPTTSGVSPVPLDATAPVTGLRTKRKPRSSAKAVSAPTSEAYRITDSLNALNVAEVVDRFSDMGIICCVQKPSEGPERMQRCLSLAIAADIFIVDWDLDRTDKQLARDILKQVMQADQLSGGRARLLVVYTAQNYPDQMLKDIAEDVAVVFNETPKLNPEGGYVTLGQLRIVILNKKRTPNPLYGSRVVAFSNLPRVVVGEFEHLMCGIIPSATLHVIAALREKTHQILGLLNQTLDGAFCAHRALLDEPGDSVDFAMRLISAEIETILQTDAKARETVDSVGLKAWFRSTFRGRDLLTLHGDYSLKTQTVWNCIDSGAKQTGDNSIRVQLASAWAYARQKKQANIRKKQDGSPLTIDQAIKLIESGDIDKVADCSPPNKSRFAELLYEKGEDALAACSEIARIQCTARDSSGRTYFDSGQAPVLQLGSILLDPKKTPENYLLCLHPPCDSVRLKDLTAFLFVDLLAGDAKTADIILRLGTGIYMPLILRSTNQKMTLRTISFKPGSRDRIFAQKWRGEWRMRASTGRSYRWVGDLRREKGQSIVHRVATNTSRIGIDEFEWLRMQASKWPG